MWLTSSSTKHRFYFFWPNRQPGSLPESNIMAVMKWMNVFLNVNCTLYYGAHSHFALCLQNMWRVAVTVAWDIWNPEVRFLYTIHTYYIGWKAYKPIAGSKIYWLCLNYICTLWCFGCTRVLFPAQRKHFSLAAQLFGLTSTSPGAPGPEMIK